MDDRLHARLHATELPDCGHAHTEPHSPAGEAHEQACAIELFAAGLSLPVDPSHMVVEPLGLTVAEAGSFTGTTVPLVPHRQPPGRGPPLG